MFKRFFTGLIMAFAIISGVYGQDKGTQDFIKYEPGDGLKIAVTEFVSPTTSQTVTLYGVVHVADAEYYQKVQKDLDGFDAVLYEAVGGDKKHMMEAKKNGGSFLSAFQHIFGDVLDLNFQLDSIDYTKDNLVHADIAAEDLQDKMKDQDVTPLGQFLKNDTLNSIAPFIKKIGPYLKEFLKTQPGLQNGLKDKFAQQMSQADIRTQFPEEFYNSIVVERNKIVIKVLQDQFKNCPQKKSFAIFYGAAHMPDMQKRLEDLGFKQNNKRWMTAWKVEKVEQSEDNDEVPNPNKPRQQRGDDHQKNIPDDK